MEPGKYEGHLSNIGHMSGNSEFDDAEYTTHEGKRKKNKSECKRIYLKRVESYKERQLKKTKRWRI